MLAEITFMRDKAILTIGNELTFSGKCPVIGIMILASEGRRIVGIAIADAVKRVITLRFDANSVAVQIIASFLQVGSIC